MLGFIDDLLTSGHSFSKNDNLQRFRFSLLNSISLITLVTTFFYLFVSILNIVPYAPVYVTMISIYGVACFISRYLLRKNKSYYALSVNIIVLTSLSVFYVALFVVTNDEFRLIWFFLLVFTSFVLMGRQYTIILTLLILVSIIVINQFFELGFSGVAQLTFLVSFLIFNSFSYIFLLKIEKDEHEFKKLNNKLVDKIANEIRERKEQEEMLLRQSRMANMGEMLDSIAHQWRQPLMHINSILMNMDSSINRTRTITQNQINVKVDEIATLTAHMSQTIEDFRGLFSVEKEQIHLTLADAINDVLTLMKNSFNNIKVDYKIIGETTILAHRSELIQLIIILLSNAVEALNNHNNHNKKITIMAYTSGSGGVITIEDNAGGIKSKNVDAIFDPYFTTKEQSGGTGLGLYIAKIIAEQKIGGEIIAANTSAGAKFTILLNKD